MHFSQNIKLLRRRRNRTQDELSHILGMKRSTLSGYENEVAEPGIQALMAFSKYFGVAVDTLIRVPLGQLSESQLSELERGNDVFLRGSKLRVLATTVDGDNEENIELVNEKAKAGYTNGFADPEFIQQLPTFQLPFLSHNKKYRTFQLSGDSMLPIPNRSWVTGEFVQDWNDIVTGEAYVVLTLDEGIVFKVVENLLKKDNKLTMYSLNPVYEPFDLNIVEIREVWRFIHFISEELPEPVLPEADLIKTVANLKHDMDALKKSVMPKKH